MYYTAYITHTVQFKQLISICILIIWFIRFNNCKRFQKKKGNVKEESKQEEIEQNRKKKKEIEGE